MRSRANAHRVRQAPLAALGLTVAETSALDGASTIVHVPSGAVLCRQGSVGNQMAWILSGTAHVVRSGDVIASLADGDVLGEGTMLGAHDSCSADVVAATPMQLAVLSKQDWRVVERRSPALVNRLFEIALDRASPLAA